MLQAMWHQTLLFVIMVLMGSGVMAQSPAPAFPLTETAKKLDQASIDAAVAAAKAIDVDTATSSALLNRGLMLYQEDKFQEAIPFLEETLRQDPSAKSGWEALGWAYMKTKETEKCHQLWNYFQQLMPGEWMPYNLLAQEAILNQDWGTADKNFEKALKIKPDLFDLRFWYAQNLLRLGRPVEAEKVFHQLIKEEPGRLDIQINLANLLIYKLQYDEAVEIYRHVNVELPGNVSFMMDQAALELRVGELQTADQLCLDVMAVETNNMRAMTLRADIAEMGGMTQQSVDRLQKVIDVTTDPVLRAKLHVRMATRCHLLNEHKQAHFSADYILDLLRQAIEENPLDVATQEIYAEHLFQDERFGESRKWAVHVLEKFNRHSVRAKDLLFELALVEQRFDDAEQVLNDRFANYDPTDPMRYYYEARLLVARGSYNEALQKLDFMEAAGTQGTVLTLLYHDLTESDWLPVTSVRRLHEHLYALKQEGFTFISPTDIPAKVGLPLGVRRADPEPEEEAVPWTALLIDHVRYGLTGERKFKSGKKAKKPLPPPMKVVAVTFDDALRSAFMLGAPVAEEVGVPFGMFAICKPSAEYVPSVAGWEEMKEYAAAGTWVIGSHLYGAHIDLKADRDGKDMRRSLPNRVWLDDKNRQESMNEWDRRMRNEFRQSRKVLRDKLGENDSPVAMVAYPFGDIGQDSTCNLSLLRNPTQSILSEAARSYKVGFVEGKSGYTTAGDNLLLSRRYEPDWTDEGSDVVRHAYQYHPVFMARRTRVEIAFLMNKPHLAQDMLVALRRDGYPEELCRNIAEEVHSHFRNRPLRDMRPLVASTSVAVESTAGGGQTQPVNDPQTLQASHTATGTAFDAPNGADKTQASAGAKSDLNVTNIANVGTYQVGKEDPWLHLSSPSVGAEVSQTKANDQFDILRYGFRGGVGLNRKLRLSVDYFESDIEQRIRPMWNRVRENDRVKWAYVGKTDATKDPYKYSNNKTDYKKYADDPDYKIDSREVPSKSYIFDAMRRDIRARLSFRSDSGAVMSGSLGQVKLNTDESNPNGANLFDEWNEDEEEDAYVGDLSANWFPRDDLNIYVFYAHDLVTSAVKKIMSDSAGAIARYKPTDRWDVSTRGVYWSYDDDNALFYAQAEMFREMDADMGIWLGLDLSTTSASKACDYYWAPYWDQRAMAVLRYLQSWQGYNFRLDLMSGLHSEETRPIKDAADEGLSGGSDWTPAWGISSAYSKQLTRRLDVFIDANVTALQEYIDHRFLIGFNLGF